MIYTTLLLIGALGLFAQAVFGLGHGHAGGHQAGGHGHGAGGHGAHGQGTHAPTHGHGAHGQAGQNGQTAQAQHGQNSQSRTAQAELHGGHGASQIWTLLSPLTIFSVCLGVGATGLLLRPQHWAGALTALAAIVGGLLFYGLVIRPLWALVFRFASTPGTALEGAVAGECEALGRFDAQGRGMVKLSIDGQRARVLAFLEESDRSQAVTPGEQLTVISVDTRANTCRVARL